MKLDSVFDLPCECGCCEEEDAIDCEGCLLDNLPMCWGGSEDDYYMYCSKCWYILTTEGMNGPVIRVNKPNVYMNCREEE